MRGGGKAAPGLIQIRLEPCTMLQGLVQSQPVESGLGYSVRMYNGNDCAQGLLQISL